MMEIWKDVVGYEGIYQVSSFGRVKSLLFKKERIMKPGINSSNYLCVNLWKNRKLKSFQVHRLVSLSFISNINNKSEVNHKNLIRTDNNVENLEWVTHRENITHGKLARKKKLGNITGVYWIKEKNKWRANITINKKNLFLGYFDSEIDASFAYQNKLKSL